MLKNSDPKQLAIDLMARSVCSVQVSAVIADSHGIFGWGWNSVGSGFGEHAEAAAIRRSSRERMVGATIYVASQRKKHAKAVLSKPCDQCELRILKAELARVMYRAADGKWVEL